MRNHSDSPVNQEMDYLAMANDVDLYYRENNISDSLLIGHSMVHLFTFVIQLISKKKGGKTAMVAALQNPHYCIFHHQKFQNLFICFI